MKCNNGFLSIAAYELVEEGKDIKDCLDRIQVGDWGADNPEQKLQTCANEVKATSDCGSSFFFRSTKGRCVCEKKGANCLRKNLDEFSEYRLLNV